MSDRDWCHACGRIASVQDLEKQQAPDVFTEPREGEIALGVYIIPFRLHSHDPRNMTAFQERWESENWTLDEAEMDEDTFRHRLGPRPLSKNILQMVPVVPVDKIPTDGFLHKPNKSNDRKAVTANQTVAILLEDRNHRALLEELYCQRVNNHRALLEELFCQRVNSVKRPPSPLVPACLPAISGGITASWNKIERRGELNIHVHLTQRAFIDQGLWPNPNHIGSTLSRFFAAWYGVVFPLHELLPIKACETSKSYRQDVRRQFEYYNVPGLFDCNGESEKNSGSNNRGDSRGWNSDAAQSSNKPAPISEEERDGVKEFNRLVRMRTSTYSFQSSTSSSCGGGVSDGDVTFRGTLRRYFSETVVEDAQTDRIAVSSSWFSRSAGLVGHHLDLMWSPLTVPNVLHRKFLTYLRDEDYPLLIDNLSKGTSAIWNRTKTFAGLLQQLENLCHKSAPHVDGLNVELLNYQRQAVGWAIERENMLGGIQSLFWTKLPVEHGRCAADLWFNPILDCVSKTPPKRVRGGFICHEMGAPFSCAVLSLFTCFHPCEASNMDLLTYLFSRFISSIIFWEGLGKTVISLAVILQNPAPLKPESGMQVMDIIPTGWTKPDKPYKAPESWASIYSRGTLVICSVSLVGQWVDEASRSFWCWCFIHNTVRYKFENDHHESPTVFPCFVSLATNGIA